MSTITHEVNNIITSTFDNRRKAITNNVYDFYPVFKLLKEKGQTAVPTGGQYAEYPVAMAKNETGRFIGRGGTVPLSDTEFLDIARYIWSTYAININNYREDLRINRGKPLVLSLLKAKVKNTEQAIADNLENALADNPVPGSVVLTALSDIVKTSSQTSGTTGGITRDANIWYNQLTSMSGESAALYLTDRMMTMMNNCSVVGQGIQRLPDIIVTTQTIYEYYEMEVEKANQNYNKAILDLGFGGGLKYKQATMVWSPPFSTNQANNMFFLNSSNLQVQIDPFANMRMTSWKEIPNQPFDSVAQIVVVSQLVCNCLRNQGVITNISTA